MTVSECMMSLSRMLVWFVIVLYHCYRKKVQHARRAHVNRQSMTFEGFPVFWVVPVDRRVHLSLLKTTSIMWKESRRRLSSANILHNAMSHGLVWNGHWIWAEIITSLFIIKNVQVGPLSHIPFSGSCWREPALLLFLVRLENALAERVLPQYQKQAIIWPSLNLRSQAELQITSTINGLFPIWCSSLRLYRK